VKRLLLAAAGLAGSLFAIPTMAASAAPLPAVSSVAPAASDALPSVVKVVSAVRTAPLVKVTVVSGDTLSGIAASHPPSTWPAWAAYNHIANPNLIYPGQVFTMPPAGYRGSVQIAAPVARYIPPQRTYSAPARTYSAPAPAPVVSYSGGGGSFTGVWACIARYESGGNAATNTGNGYYGGLQFTLGTWQANGGTGNPANASAAEQQRVANNVVRNSGGSYGAWPNTSRMCGV